MDLISIDPSKWQTGIYIKSGEAEEHCHIAPSRNLEHQEVLLTIYDSLSDILSVHPELQLALIEGYSYNTKNPTTTGILGEVIGVQLLALAQYDIPYLTIPTNSWKKYTISCKAKKSSEQDGKWKPDHPAYLQLVADYCGKQFDNTDQADAYLIYRGVAEMMMQEKLDKNELKLRQQIRYIMKNPVEFRAGSAIVWR